MYVVCPDEDLVVDFERGGCGSLSVGEPFHPVGGGGKGSACGVVSVADRREQLLGVGYGGRGAGVELYGRIYQRKWVIPIRTEKGGLQSRRVAGIVVGKFGSVEQTRPVGLEVVNIATKVMFDRLVSPFGLAVGLGMEGGGEAKARA